MEKLPLKQRATQSLSGRHWKGGKNSNYTYEGTQYRGGRVKGHKNLKKLDNGNFLNQFGVEFTIAERKALENEVNKANRKRSKMLSEEAKLPRMSGGVDTGDTLNTLQLMGRESDFILARKSKSLQRFKTREDFERYLDNVKRVNSPTYIDDRTRLYKRNHMKALDNVFGDEAKDIKMKIRMMKPADYRKLMQQDELLEINFLYDPSARTGKLNQIRTALGMKLKEDNIEDI